jgi:dienelactone hydrolase
MSNGLAALGVCVVILVSGKAAHAQRTIQIPADSGTVTVDIYGSGDRGVVLAHGGRFNRQSWKDQAETLAAAGFRVAAIDFRAGVAARAGRESACVYDEHCLAIDVLAAVRYLRARGAKTVSVVGASLGGGAAAQASASAPPGTIDRVVLIAHMSVAKPEAINGRKLFIVAQHDTGSGDVPRLPEIRAQFAQATEPKELVVLDGSAHAQFIFRSSEGPRLMREIVRFLTAP